jgi:hypothetical protein
MKTLHVFTEEPSAKIVFEAILPKILPEDVLFSVYPHQGKQDLERALEKVVPSISRTPGATILITRDQDNEDCMDVKQSILKELNGKCHCPYFVRIICRELESWFLGDLAAIQSAYPRFKPEQYIHKAEFRDVDDIDYPSRKLMTIIPEYSKRDTLPKLEVSGAIAPLLDLEKNSSPSFNHTIAAIRKLSAS